SFGRSLKNKKLHLLLYLLCVYTCFIGTTDPSTAGSFLRNSAWRLGLHPPLQIAMTFQCPFCEVDMEVVGDPPTNTRMCPVCYVLQWDEDGRTETRHPQTPPERIK